MAEVAVSFSTDQAMLAPQVDASEATRVRKEFYIMAFTFSLNHATVTTPLIYSSSILTVFIGNLSNSFLYGGTFITSLFLANIIYAMVGPKKGLVSAMTLYSVYVLLFALATAQCEEHKKGGGCLKEKPLMYPLAIGGAVIGGFGAGLLWTCQGAFYALVCEKIAIAEDRPKEAVTADYAGKFGLVFLGFECGVRATTTLMTGSKYLNMSFLAAFLIWAAAAAAAAICFALLSTDLKPVNPAARGAVCDKLLVAVNMWPDPKLWFLQTTNITFGFAVAWISGYVAPNVLSPTLGASNLGFAGALLSGLAAIMAKVFGCIALKTGKGPVLAVGCVAFALIAILSKFASTRCPSKGSEGYGAGSCAPTTNKHTGVEAYPSYGHSDWGDAVILFYVMMGFGRAVYETTNKAIVADVFPGPKAPGAFANVFVFGTAASTVAFVLAAYKITKPFYWLLIAFAAATMPGFFAAIHMKKAEDARELACES